MAHFQTDCRSSALCEALIEVFASFPSLQPTLLAMNADKRRRSEGAGLEDRIGLAAGNGKLGYNPPNAKQVSETKGVRRRDRKVD